MGKLRQIAATCREFKNDGQKFTVARSSFPQVGDESVALLFKTEV
jgi:hypothetical protein